MPSRRWARCACVRPGRPGHGRGAHVPCVGSGVHSAASLRNHLARQAAEAQRGLPHSQCRCPRGAGQWTLAGHVFIHGGGYFLGSSATPLYDGASLARRGCVYVSVNYRLGGLGCVDLSSLSDDKHTIDSNLYLRDLVLALQWVHDNIGAFGGDPNNVTIFGRVPDRTR